MRGVLRIASPYSEKHPVGLMMTVNKYLPTTIVSCRVRGRRVLACMEGAEYIFGWKRKAAA